MKSYNEIPLLIPPRILCMFFFIAAFTVSFDIFLNVNIAGFNFRFAQLALLIPIGMSMIHPLVSRQIIRPLGFGYLMLWVFFILLFIPNTTYISRSIGYAGWLCFSVLMIFAATQIFTTEQRVLKLIRVYLYTFFFVSLFGLLQFIMPIMGIGAPFVTQWWIPGIPRINGFSYEPSYYSTYMITGFILIAYLREHGSTIIKRSQLNVMYYTVALTLVLCSSRMGWILMIIWLSRHHIRVLFNLIRGKISAKQFNSMAILSGTIVVVLGISMLSFGTSKMTAGLERMSFLVNGLGILGTSDHSSGARISGLQDTFQVFMDNPLVGHSLGGVAPAIGQQYNYTVTNNEDAKMFEGIAVFVEVLAASGIIGFIPFVIYMTKIIVSPLKLVKRIEDAEVKVILKALSYSLVFELIILQFNQNILRPYFWFHIAVLSSVYFVYLRKYKLKSA
ncbi:hypothetical protein L1N85_10670 [Paenibacillus alkaliterrae]|uniref:hypothetical protein n=1 Tax=Paenibacillus alkaliterrae TaxID=320909 RepID=UPI001F28E0B2|nr:hypothetical protein [Paenibacillus alkaliterrae]MCF2938899.1 hypothetical protein [Paenibacillus alkaliterrae]